MATGESKSKWTTKTPDDAQSQFIHDSAITLAYTGKRSEIDILQTPPASTEILWGDNSAPNQLYFGDNLPILANLLKNPMIVGKVRLIYIDPPYATNSVFKSRNQTDAYQDLLSGAQYLEFIRQRLIFLRELLAEDGSIYIHLDTKMAFHVKIILDEVFGASHFRNCITRRKCNPKNYTRKTYGNISDYIFFYTKSDEYVWNRPLDAWTDEKALKEYLYTEPETGRRFKKVPIHAPGTRNGATGQSWRGMLPPTGKHWQFTPSTLDEMDARGEIFWSSNGNPRRKIYLDNSAGIPIQDIWWDMKDAHNQNIKITGYPTEKNPDLLRRIIEASSNPDDLVLDCFSGSGTTLSVSSELKRRWIGIDNSPAAISATLSRFMRGLQPMGDFVSHEEQQKPSQLSLPLSFLEKENALEITPLSTMTDFVLHHSLIEQNASAPHLREWQRILSEAV